MFAKDYARLMFVVGAVLLEVFVVVVIAQIVTSDSYGPLAPVAFSASLPFLYLAFHLDDFWYLPSLILSRKR
jgi:hypothetical protein